MQKIQRIAYCRDGLKFFNLTDIYNVVVIKDRLFPRIYGNVQRWGNAGNLCLGSGDDIQLIRERLSATLAENQNSL